VPITTLLGRGWRATIDGTRINPGNSRVGYTNPAEIDRGSKPTKELRGSQTKRFGVIAQMWLALFLGSLQMVSEPPINTRLCGTRALHDMVLTRTSEV
jgi:hypothetical protein